MIGGQTKLTASQKYVYFFNLYAYPTSKTTQNIRISLMSMFAIYTFHFQTFLRINIATDQLCQTMYTKYVSTYSIQNK